MFSSSNYSGTVEVQKVEGEDKVLVTIKTKSFILETHKGNKYLYVAILKCNNFSLNAEDDTLIISLGFELL